MRVFPVFKMGEDKYRLKHSLDTLLELLKNTKISFSRKDEHGVNIVSTPKHKISYNANISSAAIVCEDTNEAPISIRVIERHNERTKYHLAYLFPIERAEEVKRYAKSAEAVIGRVLMQKIYGTNPINVVDLAVGESNIPLDVPNFLLEHILYFEKRL